MTPPRKHPRPLDLLAQILWPAARSIRTGFSTVVGIVLYQLVGRALSAVFGVGVAAGFILIPQVQEVLTGLADTFKPPRAGFPVDAASAVANQHWFVDDVEPAFFAYAVFVGAALLLAWTTSWTTRGLQEAVPADDLPGLLRVRHPNWLVTTDRWVAAGSGTAVLLATQGAFLMATFQPGDSELFWISSLWYCIAWTGVPLLVAWLGTGLSVRIGWWTRLVGALLAGAASCLFWWMSASSDNPRADLTILSAVLPALYWLGWHAVARLTAIGYPKLSAESAPIVLLRLFVVVALALALHHWLSTINPSLARSAGSAGIAVLELLFVTALVFALVLVLRFVSWNLPAVTGVLLIGYFIWVWNSNPEQLGREQLSALHVAAADPLAARAQRVSEAAAIEPNKMLALHSDGGGIRAAVFTALVMAAADDATCGRFGERLFAASGVSGGSIGIAMWMASRTELLNQQGSRQRAWPCAGDASTKAGREENLQSGPLAPIVARTLAQDHLSPVVASYVGVDLVSPLTNRAERGQALIDSLQDALRVEVHRQPAPHAFIGLATPLSELRIGKNVPWLLFSATDADTGQRVVFSNFPAFSLGEYRRALTLGVAALHSARFPVVSPAGEVPALVAAKETSRSAWHDAVNEKVRVVDGGYFDNSGAESLVDLIGRSTGNARPAVLSVWRLNGNPSEESSRCEAFLGSAVKHGEAVPPFSGTNAFVAVRGAHADAAVGRLQSLDQHRGMQLVHHRALQVDYERDFDAKCPRAVEGSSDVCQVTNRDVCRTSITARKPPLGWFLTRQTVQQMTPSILPSALELASDAMQDVAPSRHTGRTPLFGPAIPSGLGSR